MSNANGLMEWLLVVVFTAHLIAVNVGAAGPLFCVASEFWGTRRGNLEVVAISRRLAVWSLAGFVAGILLGAVLLAILWSTDAAYWAALHRVPEHRWWFFGGELAFYLVCMMAYVWLWNGGSRPSGRWWHRLLAVLASTNVLYHFPPLFTMLSLMCTRPNLAGAELDRSLYVELFTDAETLARLAHHWLSAITTAGIALLLLASSRSGKSQPQPQCVGRDWAATFGARAALLATALQLPTGLWLLFAAPEKTQAQLLGGEISTTIVFAIAVMMIVLLLQYLAAAALGDGSRWTAVKSAAALLVVLLLMSYVLHHTRA